MNLVASLRHLVDHQRFGELAVASQRVWDETRDPAALVLLAFSQAVAGDRNSAQAALGSVSESGVPLDLDVRVDWAGVQLALGKAPDALTLLDPALEERPDHALAWARKAVAHWQMGDAQAARSAYERSADLDMSRVPVLLGLARVRLSQGESVAAYQALMTALIRFESMHESLSPDAVSRLTFDIRTLQLEIWVEQDELARVEQWLDDRHDTLPEMEWVPLVLAVAGHLGSRNRLEQAETVLLLATQKYPENIALILHLVDLAQVRGRIQEASLRLKRAIRLAEEQDKETVSLWARLALVSPQGLIGISRHAAEKAVYLAEGLLEGDRYSVEQISFLRAQAWAALASVESQAQNYDTAEDLYRRVLDEHPNYVQALQGLGGQQLQLGRIDDAIALFERVKAVDPVKGYALLISARQIPEDPGKLAELERAAHRPSMDGGVRSGLLFQLASAWEKHKDYDKAFTLAREGNEAIKPWLNYDPKAHRNECAKIRYAFSKSLFEHRQGYGVDSELPVYVLGMPRSGTTLVEQILAGHPHIHGAGELGLMPQLIAGLERWERHVGSGRRYPDCVDDLSPKVVRGLAEKLIDELQQYDPQALRVVDKLPHNFQHIGLIKFLFPKAKIISVRRDPRDIAISNYFTDYQARFGGMGFAYDLQWIGEQLADHNLMMHHWHQLFPGEIFEVHYENLIENTESVARDLLAYVGVPWDASVLNFSELDRPVKTASVWQVRQPIYKTSTEKWRRYQAHLGPLIEGTNAKISWDPFEMVALPIPGLLQEAVDVYHQGRLDDAEYRLKQLLHHIPDHAAASAVLGVIYVRKGHWDAGIELLEKAHRICPWNTHWRNDLIQAYEMRGHTDKAEALRAEARQRTARGKTDPHGIESVSLDDDPIEVSNG